MYMYVIVDSDTNEPLLSGEYSNSPYHKPKYFIYSDLHKAKLGLGTLNYSRKRRQLPPASLFLAQIQLLEEVYEK